MPWVPPVALPCGSAVFGLAGIGVGAGWFMVENLKRQAKQDAEKIMAEGLDLETLDLAAYLEGKVQPSVKEEGQEGSGVASERVRNRPVRND
eukprot:jgi/Mesen1/8763/ME000524S08060